MDLALPPCAELVTLGETMGVVFSHDSGPLDFARTLTYGIGGAESNVAIGVSRLGGRATWIGRLGRDATGDLIDRRLRAEGVRTMTVRDASFTGLMVKHRRYGESISVDYHRGGSAGSHLERADVPTGCIEAAALLHLTGITPALSSTARDAVFGALDRAQAAGVPVSFDVNYRSRLWSPDVAAPVLRRLAARADLLFAGLDEAKLLLNESRLLLDAPRPADPADLAHALAALGPKQVVITDGPRGCAAAVDGETYRLPALEAHTVDPAGAGDAFVAGYLVEHLAGKATSERLRTAIAAGAFAVGVHGDCEGLPRREDLRLLMASDNVAR